MNGIEKIIAHIESESAAECRVITDEASQKCEELRAHYTKAAKDEFDRLVAKGKTEADTQVERLGHVAALEAKKHILTAKQEILSQAFERAAELLSGLPAEAYTAFLVNLIAGAGLAGSESIILNQNDRAKYGKAVCEAANSLLSAQGKNAQLKLSDKTRAMRGGLILECGDIEVNCSVETLIAQHKNQLSLKVAAVLLDS